MVALRNIERIVACEGSRTRAELVGTSGMGIETIKSEANPKFLRVGRNNLMSETGADVKSYYYV
jgi:hypothetical protein